MTLFYRCGNRLGSKSYLSKVSGLSVKPRPVCLQSPCPFYSTWQEEGAEAPQKAGRPVSAIPVEADKKSEGVDQWN